MKTLKVDGASWVTVSFALGLVLGAWFILAFHTGRSARCQGFPSRGIQYEVCDRGFYVSSDREHRYRVAYDVWIQSQINPTWGDDERLGA